jgi:hypothetical protein
MAAIDMHTTKEELLTVVFPVRSMPRPYNKGQLPLPVSLSKVEGRVLRRQLEE